MKVLLDHNVSERLKPLLPGHTVVAARDRRFDNWDTLENGDLLRAAEAEEFDLIVTGDKKMFKQQQNAKRMIAYLVLSTTKWRILSQAGPIIAAAVARAVPQGYEYLELGSATVRLTKSRLTGR